MIVTKLNKEELERFEARVRKALEVESGGRTEPGFYFMSSLLKISVIVYYANYGVVDAIRYRITGGRFRGSVQPSRPFASSDYPLTVSRDIPEGEGLKDKLSSVSLHTTLNLRRFEEAVVVRRDRSMNIHVSSELGVSVDPLVPLGEAMSEHGIRMLDRVGFSRMVLPEEIYSRRPSRVKFSEGDLPGVLTYLRNYYPV